MHGAAAFALFDDNVALAECVEHAGHAAELAGWADPDVLAGLVVCSEYSVLAVLDAQVAPSVQPDHAVPSVLAIHAVLSVQPDQTVPCVQVVQPVRDAHAAHIAPVIHVAPDVLVVHAGCDDLKYATQVGHCRDFLQTQASAIQSMAPERGMIQSVQTRTWASVAALRLQDFQLHLPE
jgi:hypothetical protein